MTVRWPRRVVVAAASLAVAFVASLASASTPITSGETVTASVALPGAAQDYTITVNSGNAIVVRVGEVSTQSGTFTPRIRLFAPGSVLIGTASGALAAEIAQTAGTTGSFTIVVDDAGGTATGTFRLSVFAAGSAVTVSPGDEGGPLVNGALATGTIDLGELDVYSIAATAGDAIVVRMGETVPGGALTPSLRLYSPTGTLVDSSASVGAAEVTTTAATTGTYLVVAADSSSGFGGSGGYRINLAKTGAPVVVSAGDEGGPLVNGAMKLGTLDVGDLDVYTITATAGDAIVVRMGETVSGSALTPWLRLYAPNGTLASNNTGAAAAEVTTTAAASGTYLLVAADASSSLAGSGGYRLTLAKTGDAVVVSAGDEGGALTNGALQTGAIDVGDLDVWTVSASAGDAIVVRMGELTNASALAPWLRLYSPAGVLLDSSIGAAAAEVVATAPVGGTYVVVAGDGNSGLVGSGGYRITLAKTGAAVVVSNGDEGGPMTNGVMHTGTIDVGDLDVWTFSATAGDAIVVRAGELTNASALAPWVRVYNPNGTSFGSSFGAAAAEVTGVAANTGTYLVVVGDSNSGLTGSGSYRLTLAKTGAAVVVSNGDEGGPMTNGAMHTGTIDVGDLDVWTFSATAGDAIAVRIGEVVSGSALAPWVRVYNPNGTSLGSSFGASAAEVTGVAANTGTYLVVVGDANSGLTGSGSYRLTLGKTGAKVVVSPGDEGGPLPTGVSQATIDVGDLDVWTIGAHAGDTITVTMTELVNGSALSPWLRLYSPTGTLLQSVFNASSAQVTAVAASTGTYVLFAGDANSGLVGSGGYTLTKAAGLATNSALSALTTSKGTLSPSFSSGTLAYTTAFVSSDNTVTVTPTLADLTATVKVNGVVVASGDPSLPITLAEGSNPVTVVVTAQDGVSTTAYTIDVQFLFASSCVYTLAPLDIAGYPAAGGSPNVVVTVPALCPLPVTSYQPWVAVNGITPGGATTTVSLGIAPNAGAPRATSILLGDRLFHIQQLGP